MTLEEAYEIIRDRAEFAKKECPELDYTGALAVAARLMKTILDLKAEAKEAGT